MPQDSRDTHWICGREIGRGPIEESSLDTRCLKMVAGSFYEQLQESVCGFPSGVAKINMAERLAGGRD